MKVGNKNYCISQCAKDKWQNLISDVIDLVLATIAIVALTFLVFLVGLATEGIMVVWFEQIAFVHDPYILVGLVVSVLIILVALLIAFSIEVVKSLYKFTKNLWWNVSTIAYESVNKHYESKYKPTCKLLEECND